MDKGNGAADGDVRRDLGGGVRRIDRKRSHGDGQSSIGDSGCGTGVVVCGDGGWLDHDDGAVDLQLFVHARAYQHATQSYGGEGNVHVGQQPEWRDGGDVDFDYV